MGKKGNHPLVKKYYDHCGVRQMALMVESELNQFATWLDSRAVEHSVQRTAEHAEDCDVNVGMLGECDCGVED